MFGFLKKNFKKIVDKFSKNVDDEAEESKEILKEGDIQKKDLIEKEEKKPAKNENICKKKEKKEDVVKKSIETDSDKILDSTKKELKESKEKSVLSGVLEDEKIEDLFDEVEDVDKKKKRSGVEELKEISDKKDLDFEKKKLEKKEKDFEKDSDFVRKDFEKDFSEKKSFAEDYVQKPKGFFGRIKSAFTTKKISEEKFNELFWDLELALLENNTAVEVIEKIKEDLKKSIVEKTLPKGKIDEIIVSSLKYSIEDLFFPNFDLIDLVKNSEKRPFVICFLGINGSGKTTSIAKVADLLMKNNLSVVLAAADTFRAAAIDQLALHAEKLGVKLIKQDYGSDPAAVAFDAVKHAESVKKDVVLIDTAGRIHSNSNLMDELFKIIRVAKPDLKIFVGESITGNDCTEQAKKFNEAVGIDGIILSKADVDEKGGAAISVSFVTKKPILYLGTGQEYSDLEFFRKEKIIESIGL
jgi:fused signal recognition particle receptor